MFRQMWSSSDRGNCCLLLLLMLLIYVPLMHMCVEAGSNTSTVTLRVVRGDEKETKCLGV
jgi:hypothetical protein